MPAPRNRRPSEALRAVSIFLAAFLCVLLARPRSAQAHAVGVSSGEYRLDGAIVYGDLGMSGRELALWLPELDTNQDQGIDSDEISEGKAVVARALTAGITVRGDGQSCVGALDRAFALEAEGGVAFQVHYTCPAPPTRLVIALPMLDSLTSRHRHLARIFRAGKPQINVFDRAHETWDLDPPSSPNAPASTSSPSGSLFGSMLELGVEHILTGADHLVFLFGLILVGGTFRSLLGVVSAFTLAHSITLALAALSIFAPSPLFVEPAIALSIAYVGVENFFVKNAEKRWRITFPFGLIHGFGFAGALAEIDLPRAEVPKALACFNVGVELGQLAVLAVALPVALAARRASWFGERGVKLLSIAIAVGGFVLFVVRVVAR